MSSFSSRKTPRTPSSTSKQPVSNIHTVNCFVSRRPVDKSPSLARHRVQMKKSQNEEVKRFRQAVRDVYHQTDRFATYQRTSVLKNPPELTSDRYLLGRFHHPKEFTPTGTIHPLVTKHRDGVLDEERLARERQENSQQIFVNVDIPQSEPVEIPENLAPLEEEEKHEETPIEEEEEVHEENPEEKQPPGPAPVFKPELISIKVKPEPSSDDQEEEEEVVSQNEESHEEEENREEEVNHTEEEVNHTEEETVNVEEEDESRKIEEEEEEAKDEESSTKSEEEKATHTPVFTLNKPNGNVTLPVLDLQLNNEAPKASPRSYKSPYSPRQPMMFPKLDPNDPSLIKAGDQLLEISIRPFLYSLSQKYGHPITMLREIPEYELHDWKSMGFQWVWLYGAWTLGDKCLEFDLNDQILLDRYNEYLPDWTNEDVIGYPLSIVKYELNPQLGTMEDLVWFRDQLRQRGMRLMLDFVPNDTAIDAPEYTEHPNYYMHAVKGDHDENGKVDLARFMEDGVAYGAGKWMPPMRFTAQLNIFNREVREMQINKLAHISKYCDGVRVHLAQYLINDNFATYWRDQLQGEENGNFEMPEIEFWKEAIDRVRTTYPDFVMMAESYGYENQEMLLNCGFNYIYEKELIDHLASGDIHGFRDLIFQNHFITKKMVHFIENHDEMRAITRFWGNFKATTAATVALLTLPGIRLINFHQWLGYKHQIDVNLRRAQKESCDQKMILFYTRLFRVLETNAIRYGEWEPLPVHDAHNVVAWKWVKDNQHLLITVNFSNDWSGGRVICNDAPLDMREINVHEMISNTTYVRDPHEMRETGLYLCLEAYQSQIFEY
ncbi:hypothetical protein TRFO_03619 [Tritrichomonas foetus]|uniref:Glycosyl hydrolase family 13 catalytic domain-containing protein n=1 Tax=Tritrichomonas foetus TaxID=1144522 RepID=A0A1J4KSY6_9EUKA|nr:hypothetical protein TRFO_03619 [Tritrichomonas foetus]|eukprot:OHT12597.1 hypothetical protein TRFO_03619 [Tritrichomonas foetus]